MTIFLDLDGTLLDHDLAGACGGWPVPPLVSQSLPDRLTQ